MFSLYPSLCYFFTLPLCVCEMEGNEEEKLFCMVFAYLSSIGLLVLQLLWICDGLLLFFILIHMSKDIYTIFMEIFFILKNNVCRVYVLNVNI